MTASVAVSLRERRASDLPFLRRWLTDPQAEWRAWDAPYLHAHAATQALSAYADALAALPPDPDELVIAVDDRPAGLVRRSEEEPVGGGWWELGILILDPADWGGGVGTRALSLWVQDTWDWTDAHVLTLTTWSGNVRMLRAAERLGFRECARVREARLVGAQRFDSVRFDLLRSEWQGKG
ncbi:GNAT family N-acetyltransferase [Deinococcus lacus]|uniref:GNAT family N-acetyltransferase n=1 Tax=Deinococcus lacus TaxID=392561 RepID=A0ABW1Y906_9DEIO